MTQLATIFALIEVIFIFLFMFILIPQLFLRFAEEDEVLDRVFMGFVSTSCFFAVTVHILALTKLFDFFSMLFICGLLFVILIKMDKSKKTILGKLLSKSIFLGNFVDIESKEIIRRVFGIRSLKTWVLTQLKKILSNPIISILTVFVFLASLYVRLEYAIFHAAYLTSDMYLHLIWIKGILNNQLFYPKFGDIFYQTLK